MQKAAQLKDILWIHVKYQKSPLHKTYSKQHSMLQSKQKRSNDDQK